MYTESISIHQKLTQHCKSTVSLKNKNETPQKDFKWFSSSEVSTSYREVAERIHKPREPS